MNRNYVFYVLVTQCCANGKYDTIISKTATNSSNYVFVGGKKRLNLVLLLNKDAQNVRLKK